MHKINGWKRGLIIEIVNALTVDVEDWYHVCGLAAEPRIPSEQWRVRANTERILAILAAADVRATFFVLGSVADAVPDLVPLIAAAGHEIASHGYSHRLITELDPIGFRDELRKTGEILERQSGRKTVGFRAPQWSLPSAAQWAFEILHEEGYSYDSSCNPLPFVGERKGSRTPFRISVKRGTLWEIPPMVTPTAVGNMPTGGGWGFRFFPMGMIRRSTCVLNMSGAPAVFYFHPREFDPDGPRLPLGPIKEFASYGSRKDPTRRLEELLRSFRFTTLKELVEKWNSA